MGGPVKAYADQRNLPGVEGTSRLSPHLHFGEIGPRQVWRAVHAAMDAGQAPADQAAKFLAELGWREFNHHLLFHWPNLPTANFKPEFDRFVWREDPAALRAWQTGRTGYPIVDAGMRELWATGFMHNRVRMIVASFLIKHLMIDWREGEAWFRDTLVDADIAQNAANWQWVAGSAPTPRPGSGFSTPSPRARSSTPTASMSAAGSPNLRNCPMTSSTSRGPPPKAVSSRRASGWVAPTPVLLSITPMPAPARWMRTPPSRPAEELPS